MSLSDQRKQKNDELKKKVAMITNQEKLETGSVMSSESNDQKFFITGAKVGSKKKKESPTARAAKALAIMNGEMPPMSLVPRPDSSDDSSEDKDEVMAIGYGGKKQLQDEAIEEADRLEKEMNDMYRELEDMQKMIAGNKDLKVMENLMGTT